MVSKRISRLVKILSGAAGDAEDQIFLLEGRLERFVHFWALVIRQFIRHRCFVRASALSYSTLIALIPLLAVALSVTSSLLKNQGEEQFQHAIEKFASALIPPARAHKRGPAPPHSDHVAPEVPRHAREVSSFVFRLSCFRFSPPIGSRLTMDASEAQNHEYLR